MNKAQLQKNVGWIVRLRPPAAGAGMAGHDDFWRIESVGDESIRLVNNRTEAEARLGPDAILSFMSDPGRGTRHGFLQLGAQVTTRSDGPADLEPLPLPRAVAPQVRELRLELRKSLVDTRWRINELVRLVDTAKQSRLAVASANGTARTGGTEAFKDGCQRDSGQARAWAVAIPSDDSDFGALSEAEIDTELVKVHEVLAQVDERVRFYERQVANDDREREALRERYRGPRQS